jgi:hypothetical protein
MKALLIYFLIGFINNLIAIFFLDVKYETKLEFLSGIIFWPFMYLYFILLAIKK